MRGRVMTSKTTRVGHNYFQPETTARDHHPPSTQLSACRRNSAGPHAHLWAGAEVGGAVIIGPDDGQDSPTPRTAGTAMLPLVGRGGASTARQGRASNTMLNGV